MASTRRIPSKPIPADKPPLPQPRRETTTREGALTHAEEHAFARQWQAVHDTDALARLVEAHLGLVVKIATEFRGSGPSMEDLIQEGNLGLTIAARRFDPSQGTRLATYATYWIRACMMEHVVRSHGPVRIGTTRAQRKIFFGMGRARRRIERNGHVASAEALADALGVEVGEVEAMAPRLSSRDMSLDAPRAIDDEREVGALLAMDAASPEEMVAGHEEDDSRKHRLIAGLDTLEPRERAIIEARHMTQAPATLESLGRRFRVSRERVRQIEMRAIAKLRVACGLPARPPTSPSFAALH